MTKETALGTLADSRRRIDEIDLRLLELLNARARVVEDIGHAKRVLRMPIYEPRREDEVYENITRHNGGPLPSEAVKRVFERIIDEMRTVQKMRMQSRGGTR